jgi:hypothetical protein
MDPDIISSAIDQIAKEYSVAKTNHQGSKSELTK